MLCIISNTCCKQNILSMHDRPVLNPHCSSSSSNESYYFLKFSIKFFKVIYVLFYSRYYLGVMLFNTLMFEFEYINSNLYTSQENLNYTLCECEFKSKQAVCSYKLTILVQDIIGLCGKTSL